MSGCQQYRKKETTGGDKQGGSTNNIFSFHLIFLLDVEVVFELKEVLEEQYFCFKMEKMSICWSTHNECSGCSVQLQNLSWIVCCNVGCIGIFSWIFFLDIFSVIRCSFLTSTWWCNTILSNPIHF